MTKGRSLISTKRFQIFRNERFVSSVLLKRGLKFQIQKYDLPFYSNMIINIDSELAVLCARSLYTDVPPPSGKIGRGDFCESPKVIVFSVSSECWGQPLIGCNVNAMKQIISGAVIGE